jgi:D-alanyl-D-alanine dipeptidase
MLVEINQPEYEADIDLIYATDRNFTQQPVYKKALCFLHVDAAEKFKPVIKLAAALDLRVKIFDAFRPQEAQEKLWQHTPNPEFLADPRIGSNHSRGIAIDLTLLDSQGNELDMGTPFDDFTWLSYHFRTDIPQEAQRNRFILLGIMTAAGWDYNEREWWHYQLPNTHKYPLLTAQDADISIM